MEENPLFTDVVLDNPLKLSIIDEKSLSGISYFMDVLREFAADIKLKSDPVRWVRSFEKPGLIRRIQLKMMIKAILKDKDVFDENLDLIMSSVSYAISLLSDDQLKFLLGIK